MVLCVPRLTLLDDCRCDADVVLRGLSLTKCDTPDDVRSFTALIALAALKKVHHIAVNDYIKRAEPKRVQLYELIESIKKAAKEVNDEGGKVMTTGEFVRTFGVPIPPKWPEGDGRAEPLQIVVPVWLLFKVGIAPWQYYTVRGYTAITRRAAAELFKRMLFTIADNIAEIVNDMAELYRRKLPDVELPYKPRQILRRRAADSVAEAQEGTGGEGLPPCIAKLVEDLQRGENLSHFARFTIATYLIHAGWSVDQIVDLFRNAPDFDEKTTRYQVEHIAGKRGSGKRYSPPSCERMRQEGLCVANCGISNPVEWLRRRQGNMAQSS